ncbi:DUF7845 domain-containing protein [Halorussus halobius]|uniref:DUF7845 domain-containing protein n=1 Tax=Halorussus halobius TaxID=1710537 RepID=UPI0010925C45|nr:MarR family transcriptional regulator [Halorussus halobius]
MTVYVDLAPHEFAANFLYTHGGLTPYFAADSIVKRHDGSHATEFRDAGEKWVAKLYYQSSGIVHPGGYTTTGTEWSLHPHTDGKVDTISREYRIHVFRHPDEDPVEEQKVNYHMAPRWQGMKTVNNEGEVSEFSIPDQIREGVNIKAKGANIEFDRYETLLQRAADALDLNSRYFQNPHDHSNVQDAERYVRLHTDRSGPVHARDGPIAQLGHLLESDREGYRKVVQNDDDGHRNNLPGYYHTVTLGPKRVREAFPSHALPKEVKHYYAREAYQKPDSDPLAHPKLGASYQANRWDRKLGVEKDDLAQLTRELEETVLSVLAEAGLNVRPSEGADPDADPDPDRQFVPDAYFEPTESDREVSIVSLDLTELEQKQESIVIQHVADGLSPVAWETLETLVTDGGTVSPDDVAEQYDRHAGSVRRAIKQLPDLIEHDYGEIKLRSDHIAEYVYEAVQDAQDATRRAVEATARAKEAAERGVDETTGAFMAWCARVGIEVDGRRDARLTLRFDGVNNVTRKAKRAYQLWCEAGKDPQRFRSAKLDLGEKGYCPAWQALG